MVAHSAKTSATVRGICRDADAAGDELDEAQEVALPWSTDYGTAGEAIAEVADRALGRPFS
jgi:hypothetical protein